MNSDQCTVLKRLLETQMWEEALAKVDELLVSNPLAAQLYLLRGQLIQLQRENTQYSLDDSPFAQSISTILNFKQPMCAFSETNPKCAFWSQHGATHAVTY